MTGGIFYRLTEEQRVLLSDLLSHDAEVLGQVLGYEPDRKTLVAVRRRLAPLSSLGDGCRQCGLEHELNDEGLCDSCEGDRRYEEVSR